jgi:hypothetical protein
VAPVQGDHQVQEVNVQELFFDGFEFLLDGFGCYSAVEGLECEFPL